MRPYLAELIGTFVLVFGGVGSAVLAGSHIGFMGVSLAFGLSLLAMVYTIGPVSGCHINPAVTLGVLLAKKIGAKDAAIYVVAQCLGAILASRASCLWRRRRPPAMTQRSLAWAQTVLDCTPPASTPWALASWPRSF